MRFMFYILFILLNISCLYSSDVREFFIRCDIEDFEYIYENYEEDHYIPIELETAGKVWTNVEMRIRGDDSRKYPKKSLKIKFNDDPFINGRDKINFNAEYTDPTLMRQYMASYLFRKSGHPCFKAEHARLYLNGEYLGIYLMVENMDKDFLMGNDLDPLGNLYKATKDGACLSYFDDVENVWEKKTNQHKDWNDIKILIDSLEKVPESMYYEFFRDNFFYDKMINILAMNMLLSNGSTYYHNYYMYHDIYNNGKWLMMPWDLDKTFIAYSMYFPYDFSGWEWIHDNPLLERALVNEQIFSDIKAKLEYLKNTIFNTQTLGPIIDSLEVTLESSVEQDETINIDSMEEYREHIRLNREFIEGRYNYIMFQMRKFPKNFRVNRIDCIQSGKVDFSWSPSQSRSENEITYTLYLSTSSGYDENQTLIFENIDDTTYTVDELPHEDKWYYKVEAKDDNLATIGWDDHNIFIYQNGSEMPCIVEDDLTLTKKDSPILIDCDVVVMPGVTLSIEEGSELIFSSNVIMEIFGNINISGTDSEHVELFPAEKNSRSFEILFSNSTSQCNIEYLNAKNVLIKADSSDLNISRSKFTIDENVKYNGPICSLEWGKYRVKNSVFNGNGLSEGIVVRHVDFQIDSVIMNNFPDAIECDPCENSMITNNTVNFSGDDGIDLNGSKNVLIKGNRIYDISDKGISIGSRFDVRSDSIIIERNIISKCGIGIALKTARNIKIENNTLWANDLSISCSNPDNLPIGSTAEIKNTIIAGSRSEDVYIDGSSEVEIQYNICDAMLFEGTGNIKDDPELKDPQNKDFSLTSGSPCINAGDPSSPKDPDGTRCDMGAIPFINEEKVIINEICYNPLDSRDCGDWVEFYNASDFDVDIGGWIFQDDNDDHRYIFEEGMKIVAEGYLVLSNDLKAFKTYYPNVDNVIGIFAFGFSGSGELIRLYDDNDYLIDHVIYDDDYPWPTEPDGEGSTLELIDPDYDNALPESWKASSGYGTPGEKNSPVISVGPEHGDINTEVSVFPNPFSDKISIQVLSEEANDAMKIHISTLHGRTIFDLESIDFTAGQNRYDIQLNDLSCGTYFLFVNINKRLAVFPIVKIE